MSGTANLHGRFRPPPGDVRPFLRRGESELQKLCLAACFAIAAASPAIAASPSAGHERVGRTAAIGNVIGVHGSDDIVVSLGIALTPAELAPAAGRGTDAPPPAWLLTADSTLVALRGDSGVDPRQVQAADLQSVASLEVPARLRYLCPDKRYPESVTANRHTYAQCSSGGKNPRLNPFSTSPFSQAYVSKDPPPSDPTIIPCGTTMMSYSFDTIAMNGVALQTQTPQIVSFGPILNFAMEGRIVTRSTIFPAR